MKILRQIKDFFLCMLRADCEYSIKKFLVYIFTLLILYLAIFTDRDIYEILTFVAVLLGIRSYERLKAGKYTPSPSTNGDANTDNEPLLSKKKVLGD
jgi:hypothetical protein